jgi:hypothetical protein
MTTGPEVMKEWRAAEKESLSRLGFRRTDKDQYLIDLNDQDSWEGFVSLPKRIAARGSGRVDLSPIGFALTHKPTQELLLTLKEAEPPVTVTGLYWEVLPAEVERKLKRLWINETSMIADAVELVREAVEDHILPWMRSNADIDILIQYLNQPPKIGHLGRYNLESLAAVNHQLGNREEVDRALERYGEKYGQDEDAKRFMSAFRNLLA